MKPYYDLHIHTTFSDGFAIVPTYAYSWEIREAWGPMREMIISSGRGKLSLNPNESVKVIDYTFFVHQTGFDSGKVLNPILMPLKVSIGGIKRCDDTIAKNIR